MSVPDAVFALLCARTTVEGMSRNNKRVRNCIVGSMHSEKGYEPAVCRLAVGNGESKTRHQDRIDNALGVYLTCLSGGAALSGRLRFQPLENPYFDQ